MSVLGARDGGRWPMEEKGIEMRTRQTNESKDDEADEGEKCMKGLMNERVDVTCGPAGESGGQPTGEQ